MKWLSDLGYGFLAIVAVAGFKAFGRTPRFGYLAMRRLTAHGRLEFLDWLNRMLSKPFDGTDDNVGLGHSEVEAAVAGLQENGFYVFEKLLPDSLTNELVEFAHTHPCKAVSDTKSADGLVIIDEITPSSPRYDFSERDLLASPAVRELLRDASLQQIAGRYLKARPLADIVTMWWSFATGGQADSAAAQMFHCDRDRLSFVKLFVYLTDVDEQSGPHVFVRGTHRRAIPGSLQRDTRYSDEEVAAVLEHEIVRIAGRRGTFFMADTSALHKGAAVLRGRRLVFQIEWASNLFGAPYESYDANSVDPSIQEALAIDLRV